MKIIHALVLSLYLLSTATLADTSLLGLTLGKSTLKEVQHHYDITQQPSKYAPKGWDKYTLSTSNPSPIVKTDLDITEVTFMFDNAKVLGAIWLGYPSSESTFNRIKAQLDKYYPSIPALYRTQGKLAFYQNSDTHIHLEYSLYNTDLFYTDLDYKRALTVARKQQRANKKAYKDATP